MIVLVEDAATSLWNVVNAMHTETHETKQKLDGRIIGVWGIGGSVVNVLVYCLEMAKLPLLSL